MPTRTRLDPQERREQILDAAESAFAGRDASDVTLEALAEAAGVSRALLYNYFGDKGGLLAAIYLRTFERLDERLHAALRGATDDSARLRVMVEGYLRFAREHAGLWATIGQAEVMLHPVVQAARQERYGRMAAAWGGTADARLLARGVIGFLEGATLDLLDSEDRDLEGAAELLHTVLWSGLTSLGGPIHVPDQDPRRESAARQQYQAARVR